MPDLAEQRDAAGDWLEVPWWIWSQEDPRRRRVFANTATPGTLILSDLETLRVELPIAPEISPARWIDALSRMEEQGVRLRPRAVVTTLLARLLMADVFVHGIGGTAYDTITDGIVRQLIGSDPPRHAVATGTLRLPLEHVFPGIDSADPAAELADVRRTLRDVAYHPERHLPPPSERSAEVCQLVETKRRWVETVPTPALARRRCHEIRAANSRLAATAAGFVRDLEARTAALQRAVMARRILMSRTHPWCFFPEKMLREFLLLETD